MRTFARLLLLLLVLAGLGYGWYKYRGLLGHGDGIHQQAVPRPVVARGDLAGDERATIDLFEQA